MPPKKDPTARPDYRCAGNYATKLTGVELKKERALCETVNDWNKRRIATLILSPEGAARGYLATWMGFITTLGLGADLLNNVPEPNNEAGQEDARIQLTTNLAAIITRVREMSKNKKHPQKTAAKKKFDDVLWGKVGKTVVKGEVERVMRIWEEVEAAWREMTRTETPDLTPAQYKEIAVFGLEFAHSNETAVEAA